MAEEQQKIVDVDVSTLTESPGSTPVEFDGELEADVLGAKLRMNPSAPAEVDKKNNEYRHAFFQVRYKINGKDKLGNDLNLRETYGNYGVRIYTKAGMGSYAFAGKTGAAGRLCELVNTVFGKTELKDVPAAIENKKVIVRTATATYNGKEYKKVEIVRFKLA